MDFRSMKETLTEAIKAVPSVKYALGIAGVAAALALSVAMLGGLAAGLVGIVAMVLLMTLLLIFAQATKNGRIGVGPARVLIWFCLFLVMACVPVALLSVFSEDVLKARDTICSVTGALCPPVTSEKDGDRGVAPHDNTRIGRDGEEVSVQWLSLRPDKAKELLQGNGDAVRPLLHKNITFRIAEDKGTRDTIDALEMSYEDVQAVLCLTVLFSSPYKNVSVSGTVLATNLHPNQALLFCVQTTWTAGAGIASSITNSAFDGQQIEVTFLAAHGSPFAISVLYDPTALTSTESEGIDIAHNPSPEPLPFDSASIDRYIGGVI